MKDVKAMVDAYKKQDYMHQKPVVCHSINVGRYKILCQEFFSASLIRQEYINLTEEANYVCNEAEQEAILWLNREWWWI